MCDLATVKKIREAHPDSLTIAIVVADWQEMTYLYIADIKEGTRKMMRMLPETVRKGEFRRKALTPMPDGRSRWAYPTTFLMEHHTGFWQGIDVPRLEEKVSRSTWKACLAPITKRNAAGGEETQETTVAPGRVEYPSGKPLSLEETTAFRGVRPKSLVGGSFL